jgi:hypothetical protein
MIRSLPPPHAGCPRGDPGPLPVLTRLHYFTDAIPSITTFATVGMISRSFA